MTYQWSTFTRAVVVSISLIVISLLIYVIWPMLGPLIIAMLLAYVLNPVIRLVNKHAVMSHKWVVFLVYFFCLALLIIIPSLLAPVAIRQIRGLSIYLVEIETQLEEILAQPAIIFGQQIHLGQILSDFLAVTTESLSFTPAAESALIVLETTSTSLAWLVVILVSTYYFLLDGERLCDWLVSLTPEAEQPGMLRLLREIDAVWRAYLWGTLVLMLIVGVVFTIAWMAIGLPGALALGLLTGTLTVIPEVGPTLAAILAVLVAFFQGSDFLPLSNFWFAILVFIIYFVLIQIKSIWLRPRIMGRFLRLNEGLIFVSIIGAVVLWGILGALIIVPLLATMGVIGRYIRCRLLNLDPWPEAISLPANPETPDSIEIAETEVKF